MQEIDAGLPSVSLYSLLCPCGFNDRSSVSLLSLLPVFSFNQCILFMGMEVHASPSFIGLAVKAILCLLTAEVESTLLIVYCQSDLQLLFVLSSRSFSGRALILMQQSDSLALLL